MLADRVFDVKVAGVGDFRVEYDGTPVRARPRGDVAAVRFLV